MVCATTMTGLPPCTIYLPLHATPATPMESTKRFRYPVSLTMAFPKRPPGRLPHLKLTRLLIGSLTLRPAILPLENLQPLITQPLLPGTTKVYGQLLRRDFNPLDRSPKTAYGQYTYFDLPVGYLEDQTFTPLMPSDLRILILSIAMARIPLL